MFTRHSIRLTLLSLAVGLAGCSDSARDLSPVGSEDPMMQPAGKGAAPALAGRYVVVLEDGVSAAEVGARARGAAARHGAHLEDCLRHVRDPHRLLRRNVRAERLTQLGRHLAIADVK